MTTRTSKYRNVRTEYNGLMYDSQAEARRARTLDLLVDAGEILWWNKAPTFHLGLPENSYRPDFIVAGKTCTWVEDVKGKATRKFLHDKKLWKSYGKMPLRIISGSKIEDVIPKHLEAT